MTKTPAALAGGDAVGLALRRSPPPRGAARTRQALCPHGLPSTGVVPFTESQPGQSHSPRGATPRAGPGSQLWGCTVLAPHVPPPAWPWRGLGPRRPVPSRPVRRPSGLQSRGRSLLDSSLNAHHLANGWIPCQAPESRGSSQTSKRGPGSVRQEPTWGRAPVGRGPGQRGVAL